jgi:SH3-like domain-containing protein
MQPELLRGGRYEITVEGRPTLAFPVEGAGNRDIRSGWGDPRDAGSRSHQGVDIFAARGTPVLAVEDGRVRRAGTNRLGGNTLWVTGSGGRSFYYAHLDRQALGAGDPVVTGDTLGWVGNTGNAAPTPPHLHFGVRLRGGPGWVDPLPYIARMPREATPLALDTTRLGERIRTRGEVNLRRGPGVGTESQRTLPRHTVARVVAGTGDWYRVELPDRSTGFVWAPLVDGLEAAVAGLRTSEIHVVRDAPDHLAAPLDSLAPDAEVPVLGRFGDWALVRSGERDGWVFQGDAVAAG